MKLPRVRISVKRMMAVVAAVAVGLVLMREFEEGIPPKYVLRRIPARIGQLRPGMTRGQTHQILGLEKSWIWGGTSTNFGMIHGGANSIYEMYEMRAPKIVGTSSFLQSSATIQLRFHQSAQVPDAFKDESAQLIWDASAQLVSASFRVDDRTVAKMPGSR